MQKLYVYSKPIRGPPQAKSCPSLALGRACGGHFCPPHTCGGGETADTVGLGPTGRTFQGARAGANPVRRTTPHTTSVSDVSRGVVYSLRIAVRSPGVRQKGLYEAIH